jgi:hypothetical protein
LAFIASAHERLVLVQAPAQPLKGLEELKVPRAVSVTVRLAGTATAHRSSSQRNGVACPGQVISTVGAPVGTTTASVTVA